MTENIKCLYHLVTCAGITTLVAALLIFSIVCGVYKFYTGLHERIHTQLPNIDSNY